MRSIAKCKYHFGLKIRMYPNNHQKALIKKNSNASRFIYNQMVGINREIYQLKKTKLYVDVISERLKQLHIRKTVTGLTSHFIFLQDNDIDAQAKANAIQNYQRSWNMFKKVHKAGTPKFHKKNYTEKYQTNGHYGKSIKNVSLWTGNVRFTDPDHVKLPKLGVIRVAGSFKKILKRTAETRIGTITVTKDNLDRYYVSMQLGSDEPFVENLKKNNKRVGIDLNTDNFLTTSNGTVISNPRYYRTVKDKLAKEQRKLSRKRRRAESEHRKLSGSSNYQKQRLVVSKILSKVRSQRKDFLDHLSAALIKNHDLVVAEELRSSNLLKDHALAMSISDVGWRTFLQMLEYKANLYGKQFITVDPKNTTQTCNDCGHIMCGDDKLTLSDRQWDCTKCGTHHIRDHNAAINILNKGLEKIA